MAGFRGRGPSTWRVLVSHALRNKKVVATLAFLVAFCAFLAVISSGESPDLETLSLKDLEDSIELDRTNATEAPSGSSSTNEVLNELEEAPNTISSRGDQEEITIENKFDRKLKLETIIKKGRKKPVRTKETSPNACQKNSVKSTSRQDMGFQNGGEDLVVYSAYYNSRVAAETKESFVKIVGLARQNVHVYCHVWYRVEKEYRREVEIVEAVIEHQRGR